MKFKNENDKLIFESLNLDEKVIRRKLQIVRKAIDRKKSRNMKNNWRRNKHTFLKGIKKWNKSTQGKRFHRALGRFNALREENSDVLYLDFDTITDALFAISSIETHLFLELKYYETDIEALSDFLEILHEFLEDENYLKTILLNTYITGYILKEDFQKIKDLISFFIDPVMYYYELRTMNNLSNDKNQLKGEQLEIFLREKEFIENHKFDENIIDIIHSFVNASKVGEDIAPTRGQGDLGSVPNKPIGVIEPEESDSEENENPLDINNILDKELNKK